MNTRFLVKLFVTLAVLATTLGFATPAYAGEIEEYDFSIEIGIHSTEPGGTVPLENVPNLPDGEATFVVQNNESPHPTQMCVGSSEQCFDVELVANETYTFSVVISDPNPAIWLVLPDGITSIDGAGVHVTVTPTETQTLVTTVTIVPQREKEKRTPEEKYQLWLRRGGKYECREDDVKTGVDPSGVVFRYWIDPVTHKVAKRIDLIPSDIVGIASNPDTKWCETVSEFEAQGAGQTDLYLWSVTGGLIRQLTIDTPDSEANPFIASDGYIYYDNHASIYKIDKMGSNVSLVLEGATHPILAPDGTMAYQFGKNLTIGGRDTGLKGYPQNFVPDGSGIVYSYDDESYVLDFATGVPLKLDGSDFAPDPYHLGVGGILESVQNHYWFADMDLVVEATDPDWWGRNQVKFNSSLVEEWLATQ